jgi:hypothetical protein
MRVLRSEDGAALITALMLTMLSLVIAMALLSTVTMGTRISASQKRYRSALSAAQGGVELLTQELFTRLFVDAADSLKNDFSAVELQLPQYGCLQQKLNNPTAKWGDCDASADPAKSPDLTLRLSGPAKDKGFNVSVKIVDSVPGNSDKGGIDYLDTGMSAAGKDEVIHPQHVPGIYSLAVQGEKQGGDQREKARLSVLYSY